MSDREGPSGSAALDDELSLPKATVAKMIGGTVHSLFFLSLMLISCVVHIPGTFGKLELLPNDVSCAKETRDLIIECCVGGYSAYSAPERA